MHAGDRIYFHVKAASPSQRVFTAGQPAQRDGWMSACAFPSG